MKKALVTGADGFIGSHLVEYLVKQGIEVRSLVQYNSFNSYGWLDSSLVKNDIEIISGDIRDDHQCRELVKGVDTIFHLAALIAIPFSYSAPKSYVDTNVTGTLNLLNGARDSSIQRFVQTSTSEVYGTALKVPISEEHPIQPQSPYSASKIAADALVKSFHSSFGLPITIARPFNTFGPRQSARAVIPTVISQIAAKNTSIKLGDTRPTRDFNFVEDTCKGLYLVGSSPSTLGETVNIGSNFEVSIGETVELISKLMGRKISIESDPARMRPKDSEVNRLWCDNEKIKALTGFEPSFSFESGLKKTIDWFMEPSNLGKYKSDVYNV